MVETRVRASTIAPARGAAARRLVVPVAIALATGIAPWLGWYGVPAWLLGCSVLYALALTRYVDVPVVELTLFAWTLPCVLWASVTALLEFGGSRIPPTPAAASAASAAVLAVGIALAARRPVGKKWVVRSDLAALICGAGLLIAGVWVAAAKDVLNWGAAFAGGTDFARHVGAVVFLADSGAGQFRSGYPSVLHQFLALPVASGGVQAQPAGSFAAVAASLWVLVCATVVACGVAGARWAARISGSGLVAGMVASIAASMSALTLWAPVEGALPLVVGVLLTVGLTTAVLSRWSGWLIIPMAVVAVGSYQLLLPIATAAVILGGWSSRHRWSWYLIYLILIAPSVGPWLVPVWRKQIPSNFDGADRPQGFLGTVRDTTFTKMGFFGWYWILGAAAALLVVAVVIKRRDHSGMRALSCLAVGAFSWLGLQLVAGEGLAAYHYYSVKLATLLSISALPLIGAGVALLWTFGWVLVRGLPDSVRRPGVVAYAGLWGLALVGWLGFTSATEPHLSQLLDEQKRLPPVQIAAAQTWDPLGHASRTSDVMMLGVGSPKGELNQMSPFLDRLAYESLRLVPSFVVAGHATTPTGHELPGLCLWLRRHPYADRLTSNGAGPRALLDSGCPSTVVYSRTWTEVELPSEWSRSSWLG